jgi:hypothetical protein
VTPSALDRKELNVFNGDKNIRNGGGHRRQPQTLSLTVSDTNMSNVERTCVSPTNRENAIGERSLAAHPSKRTRPVLVVACKKTRPRNVSVTEGSVRD